MRLLQISVASRISVDGGEDERECFFHPRRIFRRQYVGLREAKQRTPNANGRPHSARSKGLTGFTLLFPAVSCSSLCRLARARKHCIEWLSAQFTLTNHARCLSSLVYLLLVNVSADPRIIPY